MIIVSVLYPKTSDSHFDYEYYLQKHTPLLKSSWTPMGLERVDIMGGIAGIDGTHPSYELMCHLTFTSMEHFNKALTTQGEAILQDIPSFTNVQPLVQINEPLQS